MSSAGDSSCRRSLYRVVEPIDISNPAKHPRHRRIGPDTTAAWRQHPAFHQCPCNGPYEALTSTRTASYSSTLLCTLRSAAHAPQPRRQGRWRVGSPVAPRAFSPARAASAAALTDQFTPILRHRRVDPHRKVVGARDIGRWDRVAVLQQLRQRARPRRAATRMAPSWQYRVRATWGPGRRSSLQLAISPPWSS